MAKYEPLSRSYFKLWEIVHDYFLNPEYEDNYKLITNKNLFINSSLRNNMLSPLLLIIDLFSSINGRKIKAKQNSFNKSDTLFHFSPNKILTSSLEEQQTKAETGKTKKTIVL